MKQVIEFGRFGWQVVSSFLDDKCPFLAAGLCYFVFFALFPLLLLVVAVTGYFLSAEEAMGYILRLSREAFPQQGGFLEEILQSVIAHRGQASLFGVAALLWSAKNIFLSLGQSLNIIWRVPADRGMVCENLLAVALALSLGVVLLVTSLVYAVLNALARFRFPFLGLTPDDVPGLVFVLANLYPVTVVAVVLAVLYSVLPNRRLAPREVLPGAIAAAVLWEAGRRVFAFYLDTMSRFELVYGSISGMVGFLFWLYISAAIFLLGAEIAAVLHDRRQDAAEGTAEA